MDGLLSFHSKVVVWKFFDSCFEPFTVQPNQGPGHRNVYVTDHEPM